MKCLFLRFITVCSLTVKYVTFNKHDTDLLSKSKLMQCIYLTWVFAFISCLITVTFHHVFLFSFQTFLWSSEWYRITFIVHRFAWTMEYIVFSVLLQRIAKKMLLEEIKANLSSDEDASSDEESDEGKKKTGKQNENTADDGEHQTHLEKSGAVVPVIISNVTWEIIKMFSIFNNKNLMSLSGRQINKSQCTWSWGLSSLLWLWKWFYFFCLFVFVGCFF